MKPASIIFCVCWLFLFAGSASAQIPGPAPEAACPSWAYLDSLGGAAKSEPVIAAWNGRLIIAVQGMDNGVWVKEWNRTSLAGWYEIGSGSSLSRPKFAIENGTLWLYVNGMNGFVYKTRYISPGQWSAWTYTGSPNTAFGNAGPSASAGYKAYTVYQNASIKLGECMEPYSPSWSKDLIIYEIATKEFTSPQGPETGSFGSLKAKMPYLAELGVTGVWLTGHSWSDQHYFGNIWTQYACIRPDVIDSSLGSAQDFGDMISEAHKYGIKIFLDVIDHGVVNGSPLIQEHPSWFRKDENPWRWINPDHSCPWGMTDYDWVGDQPGLENWWINTWTSYVTTYGVDGYRIDLGSEREDLWARIKDNCRKAGHDIAVFEEGGAGSGDYGRLHKVYDFFQWGLDVLGDAQQYGYPIGGRASFTNPECLRYGCYIVNISYSDGKTVSLQIPRKEAASPGRVAGRVTGAYLGKTADKVGTVAIYPDGTIDHEIAVSGIDPSKALSNVRVWDADITGIGGVWNSSGGCWYDGYNRSGDSVSIYFSPYPSENDTSAYRDLRFHTAQLSCHDYADYNLKGSRFKLGYGMMFTPLLPLFMAGEEFNNPYTEVPNKTGHCVVFGWQTCAHNPWLYASELRWDHLNTSSNRALFDDFKKAVSIRKNVTALSFFASTLKEANVLGVDDYTANIDIPTPYVRWVGNEAVLVIGNRDKQNTLSITLNLRETLQAINLSGREQYAVKDLWTASREIRNESTLESFDCSVQPDDFRIFEISPRPNNAQFINQSIPTNMIAGQKYPASISVKNTGTASWTEQGGYRLGAQNPQDNANWGTGRAYLQAGESIAPGQSKTFFFNVTAPASPGTYAFQWRMVQEFVEWFGDHTPNTAISVATTTTTTTTRATTTSTTTTTLRIPGDADGDGHVNYNDLIILAASYGKQAGETGYDPRADYNGDGQIGYDDLIILAANYGA